VGHGHFVLRALAVWLVLIAVEFVHGTLRTLYLAPQVGDFHARQISVFTGSFLIVLVAYLLVPWIHAGNTRSLILVGFLWLTLTVLFELGFGHFIFGRSWENLGSDFDILHGGLLPLGLGVLMFSPLIAARLRVSRKLSAGRERVRRGPVRL
jgi:hypothetical protein